MEHIATPEDSLAAAHAQAQQAARAQHLKLTVIVPVFNNGEHLRTTSFPSLVACPHFAQMHILLIDDGSTYQQTLDAVEELSAAYENVTALLRPTGGSGSASAARNDGLSIASTEYVGYLDPDDELLPGHWSLVQALDTHDETELAIGGQIRVFSDTSQYVDNVQHYMPDSAHQALGTAGGRVLAEARFRATNLSSWVARTQWLRATGHHQVPGAAGQDSLFFMQVFTEASHFAAVRKPTYRYHTEVPGSMVNTITAAYFHKALLRERAQRRWLEEVGLLEAFRHRRFEHFFVTWYLEKFAYVPWPQREEAAQLLTEIASLYVDDPAAHRWRFPQAMQFFGRWALPSVEGLRPWASALKHGSKKTASTATGRAGRAAARIRQNVRTRRGLDQ